MKLKNHSLPLLSQKPFVALLPLYKRVIFVDWNGVLCNDVFWSSILNDQNHPLNPSLKKACANLFTNEFSFVESWMKGEISSNEVINSFKTILGNKYDKSYLQKTLYNDCRRMKLNNELLDILSKIRKETFVVLATDNMDCFYEQIVYRKDVHSRFDSLICSSVIGVLKSHQIKSFFKPWLDSHKLDFSNALLLDDSKSNCENFERLGGKSIHVKNMKDVKFKVENWMNHTY